MKYIFNHSKLLMEPAKKETCPRCSGYGGVFPKDNGEVCYLCNGSGKVWRAKSGWTLHKWGRISQEQLWG